MIHESLNVLIFLGTLWILACLILALHRLTPRFGSILLIFMLGGLTAGLQFRSLGMFTFNLNPGSTITLAMGSYVLLPVLLLGLLIIYIIDGSIQARNTLFAILIVSLLISIFQLLPSIYQDPPGLITLTGSAPGPPPRIPLSSAFTLLVDGIVLVVFYQTLSNWRNRFPSRAAGSIALLAALWCDAIVFPTLAYWGRYEWIDQLPPNLVGKSIAGLVLLPLVVFYIRRVAPEFPNSAATVPRPPFDIFTTQSQLEALTRRQYGLIDTSRQISKLILNSDNPRELMQQASQTLAASRGYPLVWIGLASADGKAVKPIANAGLQSAYMNHFGKQTKDIVFDFGPWIEALNTGQAVLIKNLASDPNFSPWHKITLDHGLRALGIFPLRQANKILGALNVYTSDPAILNQKDETDFIQQVADDLGHATVSLEAHNQQIFLQSAANTMRDGLIITNYKGNIIYANPVITEMLGSNISEMENRSIFRLMTTDQLKTFKNEMLPKLGTEGQFTTELEMTDGQGRIFFVSIMVTLVRNSDGWPVNAIINVRDTTNRHIYEHRLLTLNRLTTELVQIRDVQELIDMILRSGQELLQASASAIHLIDIDSQAIQEIYTNSINEKDFKHIQNAIIELSGQKELLNGKEICFDDISYAIRRQRNLQSLLECGFHAVMILPIIYQRQSMGVICLYYKQAHKFDQAERQLGLTVANNLAIVLQNARLYQAEHGQRKLAEALAQASIVLNSSLDLEKVLDLILEQTMAVVPCRSVNLMLIEGSQASVVHQLYRSSSQETQRIDRGPSLPLDLPTLQHMFQSGDSLLISDTALDPRWRNQGLTTWIRSYAAAPLLTRQEVIGFLNVNSDQPNYFGPETTQRLQAFASNAAVALDNARLYQDLQKYSIELEERVQIRTAELSAAIDRIEAILASVPEAVFVLDQDQHLLEVNRAGDVLLLQAEQQNIELFDPEFLDQLQAGTAPGEKTIQEIQGRAYQVLASPLPLPQTQTGLIVVFQDVTHFRDLDRMKTKFVSDVSHELRTPLTNLSLYLDLLALETEERKRTRYQATLRRETNRLTQLIEDLLLMSRLESKRVRADMQEVDINRLIENLVQDRIPMALQRNLEMSVKITPTIPLALADPRLLTQVLSNLLTNSLNYTLAQGCIQLSSDYQSKDGGNWVTITAQDTGVGITAEELPHIFERFYRGSASRRTGAPGTGLGLAISNEIIEQMGGHITVKSKPGQGSSFTVWLQAVL